MSELATDICLSTNTDVAQRMRPISRDTNMYALGSRDSAVWSQPLSVTTARRCASAPRYRESPALSFWISHFVS